jgi:hypothetical protein
MPQTYTDFTIDPAYIPPPIEGFVWLENSDRPMWEMAIAEYTGYQLTGDEIIAVPWEPGGKTRWALFLKVKGK